MKYFIIAGEASGDLHGANLMKQIKILDPQADFSFFGGDKMMAEGGNLILHYKYMAFMGFVDVAKNFISVMDNFKLCKSEMLSYKPDAVIFLDYPGFNLRMAKFAKQHGLKTYYYISPKVWAWDKKRAKVIKRVIDKMFVIFPFEIDFYKNYNYEVSFVGNPLIDAIADEAPKDEALKKFKQINKLGEKVIAILPGSRKEEIRTNLPIMLAAAKQFPDYQVAVSGVSVFDPIFYRKMAKISEFQIIYNQTYALIKSASVALVTSGTATLETALLKTPQVVCYKTSQFAFWFGSLFIKLKRISLVNIILADDSVSELKAANMNTNKLVEEITKILPGGIKRNQILSDYEMLEKLTGGPGASERTAKAIIDDLMK